jgi:hypothetical protein
MRREYRGGARRAQLTQPLGGSTADLVITCSNLDNWPTGTGGRPFFIVVGRNTPTEEKILCISRSGNVITVFNDGLTVGRGADDTPIIAHNIGEEVEHIFTATDANEANAHVNETTGTAHGLVIANVVTTTGTQTLTNKTLTTPSIASFANATHNHQSASGGGALTVSAISDIASNYAPLNLTLNAQTASYTLVLSDAAKQVEMNVASANNLTVPTDSVAFPVGTTILVVQTGTGQTTIVPGSGVTINSTPGLRLRARWSTATLIKRAANTWLAFGDLSA